MCVCDFTGVCVCINAGVSSFVMILLAFWASLATNDALLSSQSAHEAQKLQFPCCFVLFTLHALTRGHP